MNICFLIVSAVMIMGLLFLYIMGPFSTSHVTKGGMGRVEIQALEIAANEYKEEIGSYPPVESEAFSKAMCGKNFLSKEYIILQNVPHDQEGRLLDPWGQPFWIEASDNKIKVHSYTLDRDPSTY